MAIDNTIKVDSKLAYDIGSYSGEGIASITALGYSEIFCFEPHPHYFSQLKARIDLTRLNGTGGNPLVTPYDYAVSSSTGSSTLYVYPKFPSLSSLDLEWMQLPRNSTLAVENHPSDTMWKTDYLNMITYPVNTVDLEEFITSNRRIPGYINVDAPGQDYEILKCLCYRPNMVTFRWVSERYDQTASTIQHLASLGFTIFRLDTADGNPEVLNTVTCLQRLKYYELNDADKKISGTITCN